MNCKSAGNAMLLYADKRIGPAKASALAKHLLKCDSCKEYFIAFDETEEAVFNAGSKGATETLPDAPLMAGTFSGIAESEAVKPFAAPEIPEFVMAEAPADFTGSVMKKVQALPAYQPRYAQLPDILIRVFWGLSAVIAGCALFLMYNGDASQALAAAYPGLENAARFLTELGVSLNQTIDWAAGALINIGMETGLDAVGGFAALFFVAMLGTVLFILRRGEHGTHIKA